MGSTYKSSQQQKDRVPKTKTERGLPDYSHTPRRKSHQL